MNRILPFVHNLFIDTVSYYLTRVLAPGLLWYENQVNYNFTSGLCLSHYISIVRCQLNLFVLRYWFHRTRKIVRETGTSMHVLERGELGVPQGQVRFYRPRALLARSQSEHSGHSRAALARWVTLAVLRMVMLIGTTFNCLSKLDKLGQGLRIFVFINNLCKHISYHTSTEILWKVNTRAEAFWPYLTRT